MQEKTINEIFSRWADDNPSPKIELDFVNEFTFLVAVVLSARSTDVGVNKATKSLFEVADTPRKMYDLGEEGLKEYIKSLSLFNSKTHNVISLCNILLEKYESKVPNNFEDLLKLPGVGVKTANIVMNYLFGDLNIAVDTHVFRVCNRTGLANEKNEKNTEAVLVKVVPDKWKKNAHLWLILHGRYVCKAKNPECTKCIIKDLCEYKEKELNSSL
ncbi:endonuclease III [Candidatus Uabimicrobium sp. HlEnr_7]|uniref:endonuclease III n=1 Tax=Candidatus Uabimicrobium helgolandensis TaxID=3095367 RepID=UPI0035582FEE